MAGLEPPRPAYEELRDPAIEKHNSRLGLILFALYSLVYLGFMLTNAFRPDLMKAVPFAGLNLAIVWGMGLIIGAWILAMAYAGLCRLPRSKGEAE